MIIPFGMVVLLFAFVQGKYNMGSTGAVCFIASPESRT